MKAKHFNKINIEDLSIIGCINDTPNNMYDSQYVFSYEKKDILIFFNYCLILSKHIKLYDIKIYDISTDKINPLTKFDIFQPTKMGRYELDIIHDKVKEIDIFIEKNKSMFTLLPVLDFLSKIEKLRNKKKRLLKINKLLNKNETYIQKIIKFLEYIIT